MKKFGYIFATILCGIAVSGCGKNVTMSEDLPEISFEAVDYKTVTKASEVEFSGEDFGVYCYFTPGEWQSSSVAEKKQYPYMSNLKVKRVEATVDGATTTRWRPVDSSNDQATPYYWPKAGRLNFIAYSPFNANPNYVSFDNTDGTIEGPIKFSGYTVKSDQNQVDLMYADFVADKSNVTDGANGVKILFHHALAKVKFNFIAADGTTIKEGSISATIKNVKNTGSFVGKKENPDNVWTPAQNTGSSDFTVSNTEGNVGVGPEYFIMPQNLVASSQTVQGQQLQVACTFITKAIDASTGDEYDIETPFSKTIDLQTIHGAWEVNTKYTYNLTISKTLHEIMFSVTATDWTTGANINLQ